MLKPSSASSVGVTGGRSQHTALTSFAAWAHNSQPRESSQTESRGADLFQTEVILRIADFAYMR